LFSFVYICFRQCEDNTVLSLINENISLPSEFPNFPKRPSPNPAPVESSRSIFSFPTQLSPPVETKKFDFEGSPQLKCFVAIARVMAMQFRAHQSNFAASEGVKGQAALTARTYTLQFFCRLCMSPNMGDVILQSSEAFSCLVAVMKISDFRQPIMEALVSTLVAANEKCDELYAKSFTELMQSIPPTQLVTRMSPSSPTRSALTTALATATLSSAANSPDPVSVSMDVISVITMTITHPHAQVPFLQSMFQGRFEYLTNLLNCTLERLDSVQICISVLDVLALLLRGNKKTKRMFSTVITYETLSKLISLIMKGQLTEQLMQSLLDMSVDGVFDRNAPNEQRFENCDAIKMLVGLAVSGNNTEVVMCDVLDLVRQACFRNTHNCNECVSKGLITKVCSRNSNLFSFGPVFFFFLARLRRK
jgi:hypothetical protein